MERRLAAILAADVVGYTALMGADEAGTLERLSRLRQDFLELLIAEHHGRVVKLMGDGILVEFASVVDAVACALAWQAGVAERDGALKFRIGINLGDVIVEGEDIHGDGVNVASRLEGLAEPGAICLSGDAYRQAKGKVEASFEDLGEQTLKNVAEPVRVYQWVSDMPAAKRARRRSAPAKRALPLPVFGRGVCIGRHYGGAIALARSLATTGGTGFRGRNGLSSAGPALYRGPALQQHVERPQSGLLR